jgi:hypothetical protein
MIYGLWIGTLNLPSPDTENKYFFYHCVCDSLTHARTAPMFTPKIAPCIIGFMAMSNQTTFYWFWQESEKLLWNTERREILEN